MRNTVTYTFAELEEMARQVDKLARDAFAEGYLCGAGQEADGTIDAFGLPVDALVAAAHGAAAEWRAGHAGIFERLTDA